MSSEPLLSSIIPFAGSGVAGFFMGMFLRRVLKFLVIIIGSFLGAVSLVIQWMQARQYLQGQVDCADDIDNLFKSLTLAKPLAPFIVRSYWRLHLVHLDMPTIEEVQ
jgi:uncharacterized membrane protein (Fun14 family)